MARFALMGAAAYVAPRHMKAIRDTGNELIAALDPYDNVGILDRYAPGCRFFTCFERFDRHLSKLRRRDEGPEWFAVCTPNRLHDSHCMTALRLGANVICEKPLVLSPWNLDELREWEQETGRRVYTVLQLRVHESVRKLRAGIDPDRDHEILLTYCTSRGPWFQQSWKGQEMWSGGLIFNIGIHFLDLLIWLFGRVEGVTVHHRDQLRAAGFLRFDKARVRWFLSVDPADLPPDVMGPTYRSLTIDGEEVEFSNGFTDLHTTLYRETFAGRGLTIEDARPSIELAHEIRNAEPVRDDAVTRIHPFIVRHLT